MIVCNISKTTIADTDSNNSPSMWNYATKKYLNGKVRTQTTLIAGWFLFDSDFYQLSVPDSNSYIPLAEENKNMSMPLMMPDDDNNKTNNASTISKCCCDPRACINTETIISWWSRSGAPHQEKVNQVQALDLGSCSPPPWELGYL